MGLNVFPSDRSINLSDITTANATSARHGFLPKLSNVVTEFLNGQGGFTTPAGGMATSGSAYAIIGGSASATTNGTSLTSAYTTAKASTPQGAALAAGNRYTIFLLPGIYDLSAASLTLDTEFIDIVGLSTNTGQWNSYSGNLVDQGDTIITSSISPINITVASNQDITIANVCLRTTTSGNDSCIATSQSGFLANLKVINVLCNYAGSGNRIMPWDKNFNGTWIDVRALLGTGGAGVRAFGASVASGVTVNGTFIRCKGGQNAWGGENSVSVTLSGTFIECEGGAASFAAGGSGTKTLSGTFVRCISTPSTGDMFGAASGTLSGTFTDCIAPTGVNAWGATMSGTMRGCYGSDPSWTSVTGSVLDCGFSGWNGIYPMNTADSTTISNTAAETNFSVTKTIAIKDWRVGKAFRWEAWGKLSTDAVTPGTLTIRSKFGSTVLKSSGAITMVGGVTNVGWKASGIFVLRTAGSSGTISTQLELALNNSASAAFTTIIPSNVTVTINTTIANTFQLSAEWSVADTDNAITLENFVVVPEAGN